LAWEKEHNKAAKTEQLESLGHAYDDGTLQSDQMDPLIAVSRPRETSLATLADQPLDVFY
jgi:hypothetical protein